MNSKLNNNDLINAKEKSLIFNGKVGELDAIFNGSQSINQEQAKVIAILGHPHSLHGGTMNNKVVTTLARAFRDVGIANLRFNFRGVGNSQGEFDKGIGESEDLLIIINELKQIFPDYTFILAGFSFGAYVTYRAACQTDIELLISVAPAVHHGDFTEFYNVPSPWHVIVALDDEIVAAQDILNWHQNIVPEPALHKFEETSHFFHGKLVELRKKITEIILKHVF